MALELDFGEFDREQSAAQVAALRGRPGLSFGGSFGEELGLGQYEAGARFSAYKTKGGLVMLRDFDGLAPMGQPVASYSLEMVLPHSIDAGVQDQLHGLGKKWLYILEGRDSLSQPIEGFPSEATHMFERTTTCGMTFATLSLGALYAIRMGFTTIEGMTDRGAANQRFFGRVEALRASGDVPAEEFLSDVATDAIIDLFEKD